MKKGQVWAILLIGVALGVAIPMTTSYGVAASNSQSSYQVYPNVTYTTNTGFNVTIGDNVRISNPNSFVGPDSLRFDMYSVGYIYRISSTQPGHMRIDNIQPNSVSTTITYPPYTNTSTLTNTTTTIGLAQYHAYTLPADITYFNESKTIQKNKQAFSYQTTNPGKVEIKGSNFQSGQTVIAYDGNRTVVAKSNVSSTGELTLVLPPSQYSTTHIYLTGSGGAVISSRSSSSGFIGTITGFIDYLINNIYTVLIGLAIFGGIIFYVYRGGNGGNGGSSHKTSTISPHKGH